MIFVRSSILEIVILSRWHFLSSRTSVDERRLGAMPILSTYVKAPFDGTKTTLFEILHMLIPIYYIIYRHQYMDFYVSYFLNCIIFFISSRGHLRYVLMSMYDVGSMYSRAFFSWIHAS